MLPKQFVNIVANPKTSKSFKCIALSLAERKVIVD